MNNNQKFSRTTRWLMTLAPLFVLSIWAISGFFLIPNATPPKIAANPNIKKSPKIDRPKHGDQIPKAEDPKPGAKIPPPKLTDKLIDKVGARLLEPGIVSYTLADSMRLGEPSRVVVGIKHGTIHDIQGLLKEVMNQFPEEERQRKSTNTSIDELNLSSLVSVTLLDVNDNFEINPLFKHNLRPIDSLEFTNWEWDVTPKSEKDSPLIISVATQITNRGQKSFREYKVLEKVISVRANSRFRIVKFVRQEWKWLFTTFISPFFVWSWRRIQKRLKKTKAAEIGN